MRIFIPAFVLLTILAFVLVYSPKARTVVKAHWGKVAVTVSAVAVLLALLFALMSVDTWRIF